MRTLAVPTDQFERVPAPRSVIAVDEYGPCKWCDNGTAMIIAREVDHWTLQCDMCKTSSAILRRDFDRKYLYEKLLAAAALPTINPHEKHEELERPINYCIKLVDNWDSDRRPRPPILVGKPGRGKTQILARTGRALIHKHLVPVKYTTFTDLLDEAKRGMEAQSRREYTNDTPQRIYDRAATAKVLILDDIGAERATDYTRERLQQLVDYRLSRGLVTLSATNVSPERWDETFGERTASRLSELMCLVEVNGPDWRQL